MVRVTVLGSGSRGNAIIVDLGRARIAIDAGFGPRALASRLRAAEIAPRSVDACIITHEHLDHAQGARRARDKWRWTIAATPPTLQAIGLSRATSHVQACEYHDDWTVGDARVTLLAISHDAVAPAAVLIEDTRTGARVGVVHDLGEVPPSLEVAFGSLDLLVLEANYDPGMLRAGPYPPVLQARIAGRRGHLSNAQSAAFAARVAHRNLRAVVLAHLSEQNNTPPTALTAVGGALRHTAFRGRLIAARQDGVCAVGDRATAQLALL